ncbi:MAG: DUF2017 domain-containing protein [Acidimicrobiia bacterium]|nr:DUF2017 domain-containing protein [Acidimicrobiia bacterium]
MLAEVLADRLSHDPPASDASFDRLFPRAYLDPTEEDSALEWESSVRPDLAREKAGSLTLLAACLRSASPEGATEQPVVARIGPDEVDAWLMALNDLRLDLGTRLGVDEERDPTTAAPADPDADWWSVYDFLTWCQGMLVEVILGDSDTADGTGDERT